jgi:Fe-S-cluster-containing hydrogenase component 2
MIFDMEDCGGCRTCEMACGFHHTGSFNPSHSSLRIIDRNDGKPGFLVEIVTQSISSIPTCDGCDGLEQAYCVTYCHKAEELSEMIQKAMKNSGEKK